MKTRILLITFILSGLIQASAQDKKFNFGLKVAPAISWLSSEQSGVSGDGASAKFNWGFIGACNFTDNFALVSGFNVNSLGGKLKREDTTKYSMGYRYSELQLPAIFQMRSNEIFGLKIYFQLGLAAGYLMSAKDEDGEKIPKRPLNTSWIIGSGVYVPVAGNINLLGQIKYNGGLTGIGKKKTPTHQATANFIELGLGVLF